MAPKGTTEPSRSSSRRTSTSSLPTTTSPKTKTTSSPSTTNKKRTRVEQEVIIEVPTPSTTSTSTTSLVKKGKRVSIGGEQKSKDLIDKKLNEIEIRISSEVPDPIKGVLKKKSTTVAAEVIVPVVVVATASKEKKVKASVGKKEVVSLIEPEVEEEVEDEDEGEGEIDFLKGFESDGGEDSSDEEMDGGEEEVEGGEVFDIKNLPSVKDEAAIQKKLEEKAERKKNVSSLFLVPTRFEAN